MIEVVKNIIVGLIFVICNLRTCFFLAETISLVLEITIIVVLVTGFNRNLGNI